MGWFTELTGYVAPFFLIMSPIFSYSDQIVSMHRNKTSAGFSLDIPLIMLVASFLRIFYWPYEHYDIALLIQSLLMVVVQVILLKVALDHRPSSSTKGGEAALPFAGANDGIMSAQRPYNFWQWRAPRTYWHCIAYFAGGLVILELFLSHVPGLYDVYASTIGPIGLAVEATLPIPQILSNMRTKSCKGFRLSVVASWIIGDTMKLYWFFTATTPIPWAFKVCGMFQGSCDAFLGFQYWYYGEGQAEIKGHPLTEGNWSAPPRENPTLRSHSRSLTPSRRPAPFTDAEMTE